MNDWRKWADAIASIESAGSGDYRAIGPETRKGDRAYGRYQVMDFNVGPWTEKYIGRRMTPDEFLLDDDAQDRVFAGEFGSYVDRYGNLQDAASAWFTGRPAAEGANRSDGGLTGAQYVSKFARAMGNPVSSGGGDTGLLGGLTAKAGKDDRMQSNEKAGGILGALFPNMSADRADRITIGLAGGMYRPNVGLINALQSRIDARAGKRRDSEEEQKAAAIRNRTADWLASQGAGDMAEAVRNGILSGKEGYSLFLQQNNKKPDYVYEDGQWWDKSNPGAGPIQVPGMAQGRPTEDQMKSEGDLRKEMTGSQKFKSFDAMSQAYARIGSIANNGTPASDMALIFNYMKILDPGSTVREGEYATAQNAASVPTRIVNAYNNTLDGTILSPEMRSDFLMQAHKMYKAAQDEFQNETSRQYDLANDYGLDPMRSTVDPSYRGAPVVSQRPQGRPGTPQAANPPAAQVDAQAIAEGIIQLSPQDQAMFFSIPQDDLNAQLRFLFDRGVLK